MSPSHSELERFVKYSKYFGEKQISTKEIYGKQDPKLNDELIREAVKEQSKAGYNHITNTDFYLGCVDFMMEEVDGEKTLRIVETNGGSSRGISSLPEKQWNVCNKSFLETLNQKNDGIVLIGYPPGDKMLYEKALLVEEFITKGYTHSKINELTKETDIVLAPYNKLIPKIELEDNKPVIDGHRVDIIIGDGVVRRHPQLTEKTINNKLNAVCLNKIFPITDDKSATYKAQELSKQKLLETNVKPIDFTRAYNKKEIIKEVRKRIETHGSAIIKPSRGSGGRGIEIIQNEDEIHEKINESLNEYGENFKFHENPYPYTVSEVINSKTIKYRNSNRNFDMRVYVARHKNKLKPTGGLVRVALEPQTQKFRKPSIVVNLSGYEGIDMHRGLAINKKTLKKLNTTKKEFKNIYKAAVIMFKEILKNQEKLTKYATT